jgi:hypothetical protein
MKRAYSLAAVLLLISLLIYLFYRTDQTLVNMVLAQLIPADSYSEAKATISSRLPLNSILIYSVPGGLWVLATTLLTKEYHLKFFRYKVKVELLPLAFALGLEVLQYFNIVFGRFDWLDVAAYLVAFWMARWVLTKNYQSSSADILQPFTLQSVVAILAIIVVLMAHVCH